MHKLETWHVVLLHVYDLEIGFACNKVVSACIQKLVHMISL